MNRPAICLIGAALLLTLACGGGGGGGTPAPPATTLNYSFSSGPGDTWRLVQNASASTSTHLVFDLFAPSTASGDGFTVVLTTNPAQAAWSRPDGVNYMTRVPYPNAKVSIASVAGASLRLVAGQVPGAEVPYGTSPLAEVALDMASSATVGGVTLTATAASHLAGPGDPTDIAVEVGTLQAQ